MQTIGPHPYFTNPVKQKKLEEAIRLGLIAVRTHNVEKQYVYRLTILGLRQWSYECL